MSDGTLDRPDDSPKAKEELRELVRKAAHGQDGGDVAVSYHRGHELSGVIALDIRADGAFSLSRSGRGSRNPTTSTGRLALDQTRRILSAVDDSGLLDVPDSSRNIGDDEVPITVEVGAHGTVHRLVIWALDAADSPSFSRFEASLRGIMDELAQSPASGADPAAADPAAADPAAADPAG